MKSKTLLQEKKQHFIHRKKYQKTNFPKPEPEMFLFSEYKERKFRLFHEKQQKKRENRVVYTW